MLKRFFVFTLFFVFGLTLVVLVFSQTDSAIAEQAGDQYTEIGRRAGVWNDGQAALWDLNVLDHFHYFGPEERARGYRPEQPIAFSHVRHVQKNGIDCQYCHWTVNKSSYAAVPEVETCMGCHKFVKGTQASQKKEISKIRWFWENSGIPFAVDENGMPRKNEEGVLVDESGNAVVDATGNPLTALTGEAVGIPWERVHVMPTYLRFNHKRHVKAGVSCDNCHGQVPEMEVVERVSSMKMGWCISCHRAEGASIDCATCHH